MPSGKHGGEDVSKILTFHQCPMAKCSGPRGGGEKKNKGWGLLGVPRERRHHGQRFSSQHVDVFFWFWFHNMLTVSHVSHNFFESKMKRECRKNTNDTTTNTEPWPGRRSWLFKLQRNSFPSVVGTCFLKSGPHNYNMEAGRLRCFCLYVLMFFVVTYIYIIFI